MRQLSKLRQFDPSQDPATFLSTQFRQNMQDIEANLKALGFPSWTDFTPDVLTTGGSAVAPQNVAGAFQFIGKTLWLRCIADIFYGSAPSTIKFVLPNQFSAVTDQIQILPGRNQSQGYLLQAVTDIPTQLIILRYDNNSPLGASGDRIAFSGSLEIQ